MNELENVVDAYNEAWNRQDLDAICAAHAPGNGLREPQRRRTGGRRGRPRAHRLDLRNWPDLRFAERALYAGDGFVVQEWTATATHPRRPVISWDGVDIFPFAGGKIARKDVYSNASRRVPEQLAEQRSA